MPAWLAIILSVSLVLFFGEILPSAIFTGKWQLAIASSLAWLVYMLMFLFSPIAWPLSWILVSGSWGARRGSVSRASSVAPANAVSGRGVVLFLAEAVGWNCAAGLLCVSRASVRRPGFVAGPVQVNECPPSPPYR